MAINLQEIYSVFQQNVNNEVGLEKDWTTSKVVGLEEYGIVFLKTNFTQNILFTSYF